MASVAVIAGLAVVGCGRKAAAPPVPPPVATETQPAPTVPPGPPPVSQPPVALTQPDGQVDLPELQRSVLRWVLANRRRPANFEEFAASAGIQIPPAPAGKKYNLAKDLHVQLINR